MSQKQVIPFDGQEIAQGYNSVTRDDVGTALVVANVAEDPAADGQKATTIFESVTTQEALMKSLGISASADARYGLFSTGAKFDFAESHAVNSYSSFVAGRCEVQNAIRHGHGFKLTEDALALVTAERMDDFKVAFGDMFVRSLQTGGELVFVVQITSVSDEHQSNMSAALEGEYNGLLAGGSFRAAFTKAMKETSNRTHVIAFLDQAGGIGNQVAFPGLEADKVLQRIREFPAIVHEHPVTYTIELANYNTIPIPVPTLEESQDRKIVLDDCLAQKMGFLKALSDLNFMLGNQAQLFFEDLPPKDELQKIQAQYRTALNALIAHAIGVATGKMSPPQVFVANPEPPPLNVKKRPPEPAGPIDVAAQLAAGTVDGVLIAGGFLTSADLATMNADQKRNALIASVSPRVRIPNPFFLQQFDDGALIPKGAINVLLSAAGIRSVADLRAMTLDDQRNTLIVENEARAHVTVAAQQAMTENELVHVALSWFGK